MKSVWTHAGLLAALVVCSTAVAQANGPGYAQSAPAVSGYSAGSQMMPGSYPMPAGMYGTPYDLYARTWKGRYSQPTGQDYCPPYYGNRAYPTHKFSMNYHAPRNLVYPMHNQPAGVVMYPYYTFKGPTDFFLDDPVPVSRY